MKTVSVALKAHMAGEVTTLAMLWKVTRKDAQIFGFTDHDQNITYDGTDYEAAAGFTPTSIATTSSLSVDNLEVQAMLSSGEITEVDIEAGLWDYATVEIMVVNYLDLTMGHMLLRKGTIGEIKTGQINFVAELRGMLQPLQQTVGRIFAPSCDATFGDTRCGVVAATYTVTGSVTTATSDRVFRDVARNEVTGYFDNGLLTWTSGNNDTYQMEVKTSVLSSTTASGITNISNAANAVVTVANSFSNGDTVVFNSVGGMTEINGMSGVVSAVSGSGFTVNINSNGFGVHSGSTGNAVREYNTITLHQGMPNATVLGDTYSLVAGCDKLRATCISKFDNLVNFRGFPDVPGPDKMMAKP